jgi:hypothetical protein
MEGSLSVQMDRLKRTMQNRDKRRDQERRQRMVWIFMALMRYF